MKESDLSCICVTTCNTIYHQADSPRHAQNRQANQRARPQPVAEHPQHEIRVHFLFLPHALLGATVSGGMPSGLLNVSEF